MAPKEDNSNVVEEEDTRKSRGWPEAMVILGNHTLDGAETKRSKKRKWKEILNVASTSTATVASTRPRLDFGDQDLLDGKPNEYIPLLIIAVMENWEVQRILVNQESSTGIINVHWFVEETEDHKRGLDPI